MHRYFAMPAAVTAVLGLTGCATVVRGDHTAWEVNTVPPGASVKTTNGFYCDSTPCSIQMPRRSDFSADIVKPGYKTLKVTVTHKIAAAGGAAFVGNALIGGVIGAGVDLATGAALDLTPNPVTVTLEKDDAATMAAAPPAPADAPSVVPTAATAPAAAAPAVVSTAKPTS
jgi:PEGA domain